MTVSKTFRPWGPIQWLLPKLPGEKWSLLGVLGTEDRCVATLAALRSNLRISRLLKILDPHMSPLSAFEGRFNTIQARMEENGVSPVDVRSVDLLQDIDTIRDELASFLTASGSRVVLDITSMPKRWFFPLIRFLLESSDVKTLVVTYSSAMRYDDQLSSDPLPLAPIPTFDEPRLLESYDELVVGVGFAPLGLKDLFEADIGKIRYLFPFPPGPPNFFRNWQFLRTLEAEVENRNLRAEDRWQVHMYDVPSAFEALCSVTNGACRTSALAPFGPKTLSLAMCLFALAANKAKKEPVHVYYTQPRRYGVNYTTGIGQANGSADIKAFCIRIDGRDLYDIV